MQVVILAGMFVVLTGDIVASSDLDVEALEATLDGIAGAAKGVGGWPGVSQWGFARRGGDAWQLAFDAPALGLRAALFINATIRRLDKARMTRIAMAVGAGQMPGNDPNAAHGAGFTASGRLLEALPAGRYLDDAAGGAAAAVARLADHIAQGWTPAQARALTEQLPPGAGTRAEAAARLGISRQAVDQALWAAGFPAIEAALAALEDDK
ncbi:MarR family transcriptional regulator [Roseovarius sp. A21]|uniref:MarR family transcriptional regulator n=1 Tax=Roseovarius bejariae TaxID=2576383 RepID=A0A844CN93_9RHOB|nr:MarR family transcriptional regulator [Roseovarius bejariae]MRU16821.1 MarR family transcriptional regulator [Roseovarius bejariae]